MRNLSIASRHVGCSFVSLALAFLPCSSASGQTGHAFEALNFSSLFVPEGDFDFVDKHAGSDMLPFTDDDIDLPNCGNRNGSLYFTHIDHDGDRLVDMEGLVDLRPGPTEGDTIPEHIFVQGDIDTDDEESFCLSMQSYPEYGVFYESEDFNGLHHSFNSGLGRSFDPCDPLNSGYSADFSHHDRPGWEGEWNAYSYNNLAPNQHGRGKPKHYFDLINPSNTDALEGGDFAYDEIQGWEKPISLQNSMDDPETAAYNERGRCRRDWMRSFKGITRGYIIPVDALPDLEEGDLPTLFGWEQVDLATYMRDVVGQLLDAPELDAVDPHCPHGSGISSETVIETVSHVMLYQLEVPIEIAPASGCGANDPGQNQCFDGTMAATPEEQARCQALYWGITPDTTDAVYRVSALYVMSRDSLAAAFPELRRWRDRPDDGAEKNLWLIDNFFRDNANHLGRYEVTGLPWTIIDDPGFAAFDGTRNRILVTGGPSSIRAPLPRPLAIEEAPIELVVDLGEGNLDGGGVDIATVHQLILEDADGGIVAFAEFESDGITANLGGELDGTGTARNPDSSATGPAPGDLGELSLGEFGRVVLQIDGSSVRVRVGDPGEYTVNSFERLDDFDELVSLDGVPAGQVSAVRVTTTGPSNVIAFQATLDTAQEVPAPTIPPDVIPAGSAMFSFDVATRELEFEIEYSDLSSDESGAHIHRGARGVPGPVIHPLPPGPEKTGFVVLSEEEVTDLFAGNLYVNIHSEMNRAGEIRGQILPVGGGPAVAINTIAVLAGFPAPPGVGPFLRGDSNNDGVHNISDPQYTLNFLFLGGPAPPCAATADANTDGVVNISDPQFSLNFLFLGGPPPEEPSVRCGTSEEPGDVALGCETPPTNCP